MYAGALIIYDRRTSGVALAKTRVHVTLAFMENNARQEGKAGHSRGISCVHVRPLGQMT